MVPIISSCHTVCKWEWDSTRVGFVVDKLEKRFRRTVDGLASMLLCGRILEICNMIFTYELNVLDENVHRKFVRPFQLLFWDFYTSFFSEIDSAKILPIVFSRNASRILFEISLELFFKISWEFFKKVLPRIDPYSCFANFPTSFWTIYQAFLRNVSSIFLGSSFRSFRRPKGFFPTVVFLLKNQLGFFLRSVPGIHWKL